MTSLVRISSEEKASGMRRFLFLFFLVFTGLFAFFEVASLSARSSWPVASWDNSTRAFFSGGSKAAEVGEDDLERGCVDAIECKRETRGDRVPEMHVPATAANRNRGLAEIVEGRTQRRADSAAD